MAETESGAPLRAAVIGAGIGRVHVEGYRHSGRAEVVALCDANPERAEQVACELGIPHTFTDPAVMLAEIPLDAVSVAVPNAFHADIAIAALNAGVAVLCEKPMADTLENARRIVDAVRTTGTPFMMGYNNRYRAESRYIRDAVRNGDLGRVYYGKCGWVRRKGVPGMGGWFTRKAMSGGGPLMDIGVHALDLAMWLLGFPKVRSVSGATYAEFGPKGRGAADWWSGPTGDSSFDVEDLAAGMVRFEDGGTLMIEASWAQYIPDDRLYVSLCGSEGGADVDPFRLYRDDEHGNRADFTPELTGVHGHHAEVAYFVDCLLNGTTPEATAGQGLAVMEILDALYRSAASQQEVKLG